MVNVETRRRQAEERRLQQKPKRDRGRICIGKLVSTTPTHCIFEAQDGSRKRFLVRSSAISEMVSIDTQEDQLIALTKDLVDSEIYRKQAPSWCERG